MAYADLLVLPQHAGDFVPMIPGRFVLLDGPSQIARHFVVPAMV